MKKLCSFKFSDATLERIHVLVELVDHQKREVNRYSIGGTTRTEVVETAIARMYGELISKADKQEPEGNAVAKKKHSRKKES